jgi:phosphate transport system substrate-binding protein
MTDRRRYRRAFAAAVAAVGILSASLTPAAEARPQTPAQTPKAALGVGSTYVGLAMQQWVSDAQVRGIDVNYTPTGSPNGLNRFAGRTVDFAGTEAEFSSLGQSNNVSRGYQYVPDIAGAVAIMYNVRDTAGREVDYLHLSRSTVARIFMGDITHWDDATIRQDNAAANLRLPHEPIKVVYRSGQSGTTALFYDFVAHTEPQRFASWVARNQLPTSTRIIEVPPTFAPLTHGVGDSAGMAQFVAGGSGIWSIGYDEFGYALSFGANSAWIQNAAGKWVLPYAENISAALESARLRPDLSQELSGVYSSRNPLAYPISAYSYIVTPCAPATDRSTCRGNYDDPGIARTMTDFLDYIACDGQVPAARMGYSPLPPNLSQEIINSIGRMNGTAPPRQLTAANCSNPRFKGSLGQGSAAPDDPFEGVTPTTPGSGPGSADGADGNGDGQTDTTDGDGTGAAATTTTTTESAGAGRGGVDAVGGGSGQFRNAEPTSYDGEKPAALGRWPMIILLGMLACPPLLSTLWRRLRKPKPSA